MYYVPNQNPHYVNAPPYTYDQPSVYKTFPNIIGYTNSRYDKRQSNPNRYPPEPNPSTMKTSFTKEEAAAIALLLGIDFSKSKFVFNEFWMGVNTELEHGRRDNFTNVTDDNPITTGKIALAHLNEFPDYYTRLKKLEEEAKDYWKK